MTDYTKVSASHTFNSLHIDGNYFTVESISAEEGFGRREITETPINGGKYVHLQKGAYVPKKFTFTTKVTYNPDEASKYNSEFNRLQNNICEVVSREFGTFNGYIQLKPKISTPTYTELDIDVTEVTDEPTAPKYVDPVDTQKAQEEALAAVTAEKVSSKSTKKTETDSKNSKSTVSKTSSKTTTKSSK